MKIVRSKKLVLFAVAVLASACSESGPLDPVATTNPAPQEDHAGNKVKPPEEAWQKLNYLTANAVDVEAAIPAPPAEGSGEDLDELNQLLALQASRTQQDCERANTEATFKLSAFGPPYGPLADAETARWDGFFKKVVFDTKYFVNEGKHHWRRLRPYVENPEIKPCVPLDDSGSYPSGHATESRVFADILSAIDPSREHEFTQRADQIAGDRILGGVHHLSDTEEGKVLGDRIYQALVKSAAFQEDLKSLR